MNSVMAKDLQKLFIGRGYNPVIGTIYQQQEYWLSWYRGEVDGFHNIMKKNVEATTIKLVKPSLQMAKKVSEDITSLLFNENVTMIISGDDKAQPIFDDVMEDNHSEDEIPNFIELTVGPYGTGVSVEYLAENKTKINYLFGDKVVVIDYDNTTPKAVAVVQDFQKDGKKYNHVMYHTFKEGKYRIQHEMYSSKNAQGLGKPDGLDAIFSEQELKKMRHTRKEGTTEIVEYYVEYETTTPHFQIFKLPISNNFDVRSPMGISVYANSISTLENIDEKYYSSRLDSINSRKKIFVDEEATKLMSYKDANNVLQKRKYFDPDETQFQVLRGMNEAGEPIKIYAPVYDSAQHDTTLQWELNYLSDKVLLGPNYYSYKDGVVGYQNELSLALSNGPLRRNRNRILKRLAVVFINMMKSIMYLEHTNGNYKGDLTKLEYSVQFDDDIFTDDATELLKLKTDALDGLIPEYKYIMKAYKLDKVDALALLKEAEGLVNLDDNIEPLNDDVPPTED